MKHVLPKLQPRSIRGLLKAAFAVIILCFLCMSAIYLAYLHMISQQADRQVRNAEAANHLSRMAKDTVALESWYIVAGRESFATSNISADLAGLRDGLQALHDDTHSVDGKQLAEAAILSAGTLTDYVEQLRVQSEEGAPISAWQMTLNEINQVSGGLRSLLQEFAFVQIEDMASANAELQRGVALVMLMLALLTVVITVVAVEAYRVLRGALERPARELEAMAGRMAKGDFSRQMPPPDLEELSRVDEAINQMAERIRTLLEESVEEQKNLQKSEMRALQAQIAPHFLYNTLDTIVWLAECGHTDEVVKLTVALSSYYRIALSRGRDFIPVAQEVENVRDYLAIQKIRYGDLLYYEFDVAPAMEDRLMLKLVLQPLVENALYHGIKSKRAGGRISVRGRLLLDSSLHFMVEDDGVGMQPEALEELRRSISAKVLPGEAGYGLYNVNWRLRLFYNAADLAVYSEYGKGTRVEFILPARSEP